MKMFTAKEEKNIVYLLTKATDDECGLYLEELHGLIFGLAITPGVIPADEWFPLVHGEDPAFDDEQDAEICLGYLIAAYDRMVNDRLRGKLTFPFNYDKMSDEELSLVDGWAYGLFLALSLRPDLWGMAEKYSMSELEKLPDDVIELMDAYSVITSIAVPEEMEEAFRDVMAAESIDRDELMDSFYDQLPFSVEIIQKHGAKIREGNANSNLRPGPRKSVHQEKTGRKDECPCGSGKQYKKCCGSN